VDQCPQAARADRRELAVVADLDHGGAGTRCHLQQRGVSRVIDHRGLVDQQDRTRVDRPVAVLDRVDEAIDGLRQVGTCVVSGLLCRAAGDRQRDDLATLRLPERRDHAARDPLPRPRLAGDRDEPTSARCQADSFRLVLVEREAPEGCLLDRLAHRLEVGRGPGRRVHQLLRSPTGALLRGDDAEGRHTAVGRDQQVARREHRTHHRQRGPDVDQPLRLLEGHGVHAGFRHQGVLAAEVVQELLPELLDRRRIVVAGCDARPRSAPGPQDALLRHRGVPASGGVLICPGLAQVRAVQGRLRPAVRGQELVPGRPARLALDAVAFQTAGAVLLAQAARDLLPAGGRDSQHGGWNLIELPGDVAPVIHGTGDWEAAQAEHLGQRRAGARIDLALVLRKLGSSVLRWSTSLRRGSSRPMAPWRSWSMSTPRLCVTMRRAPQATVRPGGSTGLYPN
jgi:hypothetical protein